MKILIVEDGFDDLESISEIIKHLGEIIVCRKMKTEEEEKNWEDRFPDMPSLEQIKGMIDVADLILLDEDLGHTADYSGKILLTYCQEKGKKVIGISSQYELGPYNFHSKRSLKDRWDKEREKQAKERLLSLINEVCMK